MNTLKQQKRFISEVILPVLIDLACDDKLPSDLNELSPGHFEKKIEAFNATDGVQRKEREMLKFAHANLVSVYECMRDQDYSIVDWDVLLDQIKEMEERYEFIDESGLEPEED